MKRLALLLAALLVPGASGAQDDVARRDQTRNTAYAEIETLLAKIRKTRPAERKRLFDRLYLQCGGFLDEHLASASPEQLTLTGRLWLQLAARAGDEKALVAQLARFEARKTLPSSLRRLVRLHRARLEVRPGSPAPGWSGTEIRTGARLTSASLKGRVVLLVFWSSQHQNSVTFLERQVTPLRARFEASEGFALVGVGVPGRGETAAAYSAFVKTRRLPGAMIFDSSGECALEYGVADVPFVCLVDRRGEILASGPAWRTLKRLVKLLAERLTPLPEVGSGEGEGED